MIADLHRVHGVTVRTGHGVAAFRGDSSVRVVELDDGSAVPADVVVVGVGVLPADRLARDAGLDVSPVGVVVDESGRTSVAEIYAAGDAVDQPIPVLGGRGRLEHWNNALAQGGVVGRSMLGSSAAVRDAPWFWSDQYEWNIQLAGLASGSTNVVYRGSIEAGRFSAFYLDHDDVPRAILTVNGGRDAAIARRLVRDRRPIRPTAVMDLSTDLAEFLSTPAGTAMAPSSPSTR